MRISGWGSSPVTDQDASRALAENMLAIDAVTQSNNALLQQLLWLLLAKGVREVGACRRDRYLHCREQERSSSGQPSGRNLSLTNQGNNRGRRSFSVGALTSAGARGGGLAES